MSESITIKLAAREYTVRRLTLRQSRAIGICVSRQLSADSEYVNAVDQAVEVVAMALSRDYPDMSMDALLDTVDHNQRIDGNQQNRSSVQWLH